MNVFWLGFYEINTIFHCLKQLQSHYISCIWHTQFFYSDHLMNSFYNFLHSLRIKPITLVLLAPYLSYRNKCQILSGNGIFSVPGPPNKFWSHLSVCGECNFTKYNMFLNQPLCFTRNLGTWDFGVVYSVCFDYRDLGLNEVLGKNIPLRKSLRVR